MSTTDIYLPPRLSTCHKNTTSKVHTINLALLQQFFNDSSLQSVNANSLFENPLKIETPEFNIYNHSMSTIIADDQKSHLSLQKMAKAAREESVVFKSLTDPILSGDISLDDNWSSTENIILYVSSGMAAFCMIAFVLTWLKLRKVLIIVSVLQNSQGAQASTLPSFIYKNEKNHCATSKIFFRNG